MIFSLDVRRARKGDCLLLHFGTKDEPGLVLIDGGPSGVYAPHLKPRLMQIRKARKLEEQEPLFVDLVMVSHVDDDHIKGILDLTRELIADQQPFAHVTEMWHNTFDSIIDNDPAYLTANVKGFGTAAMAEGEIPEELADLFEDDRQREAAVAGAKVLASIAQGHQLRNDATQLDIALNAGFENELVMADKEAIPLAGSDEMTIKVAGPRKEELKKLQEKHDEWLKELKKQGKKPPEALAAYLDESVANLSSIVGLVECGGKSILLTGDARGDNILEGFEEIGVLAPGGKMRVDILKVPHHGSSNNLEKDFFDRIEASHYVFSGNGQHGNPERESIEMLMDARGNDPFTIHFTYGVAEIDPEREKAWSAERDKEIERERKKKEHNKTPGVKKKALKEPREEWDDAKHSLAGLFALRPLKPGQSLVIADPVGPNVINLLDPLGFQTP